VIKNWLLFIILVKKVTQYLSFAIICSTGS